MAETPEQSWVRNFRAIEGEVEEAIYLVGEQMVAADERGERNAARRLLGSLFHLYKIKWWAGKSGDAVEEHIGE